MINQRDKNGKPHGPWEDYYDNGKMAWKGEYKKGFRHGSWEHYHSNGQLSFKCEFKNDSMDGFTIIYNWDGVVDLQGFKKNNVNVGLWYDSKHKKESEKR